MRNAASKGMILFTVVTGTFIGAMNTSIVNVSVPTLMRAFSAGLSEVEWVITAYMIAFSVTMPAVNWLKERFSYRLLYIMSIAVFSFGALLCGAAQSLDMLIVARIIQAIGGGALGPISMGIVADTFPAAERGRAFGLWGLGVVLGPAIGPTLGGYLSDYLSWRWIFYINVPLGLIAMVMGARFLHLKKLEVTHKLPFDFQGFVYITVALVSLLYSFSMMERAGLNLVVTSLLGVAILCSYLFVHRERVARAPLWNLSLFRNGIFVSCLLVTFGRSIALFGGVFLLPFVLQNQMGMSESNSGLVMFPGSIVLAAIMPLAGRWADRGHILLLTIAGLILLSLSLVLFALVLPSSPHYWVVAILLIRGIGLGLLVTPLATATINSVRQPEVAMASSISNLAQQVGGSFGIAFLVLLKSIFLHWLVARGESQANADLQSLHWCFLVSGIVVALCLVPALDLKRLGRNRAAA